MNKGFSTSAISILVQLASWRDDDDFRPIDERVSFATTAMAIIELIRIGRVRVFSDRGVSMLKVIDITSTEDYILDGILFWQDLEHTQSVVSFIEENSELVLLRCQTSLLLQNVLLDMDGAVLIPGFKQDVLRANVRKSIDLNNGSCYAHDALISTLVSVYSPNGAIIFSLLGIDYNQNFLSEMLCKKSPMFESEASIKEMSILTMGSLYQATKG